MSDGASEQSAYTKPGTVIAEKYRVERVLGEGGMGVVLKATHLILDEAVAIKVLLPQLAANEEAAARFLREAKAAFRIKGEHVARMLDVDRLPNGTPFIAMEFLDGEDLGQRVQRHGPLSIDEAVEAIIHACVALSSAHARGVIHRDLKPSNLFRTEGASGQTIVKVLDFGISKMVGERADRLTKTSSTMGSAFYMSPEQLMSARDVDSRTDIYALGVTLYELLSGRFPFEAETMPQLVAAILSGKPHPLAVFRPDVPPQLGAIVHRALANHRDDRFATAAELAVALAPFASGDASELATRLLPGARGARVSFRSPLASAPGATQSDQSFTGPRPAPAPLDGAGPDRPAHAPRQRVHVAAHAVTETVPAVENKTAPGLCPAGDAAEALSSATGTMGPDGTDPAPPEMHAREPAPAARVADAYVAPPAASAFPFSVAVPSAPPALSAATASAMSRSSLGLSARSRRPLFAVVVGGAAVVLLLSVVGIWAAVRTGPQEPAASSESQPSAQGSRSEPAHDLVPIPSSESSVATTEDKVVPSEPSTSKRDRKKAPFRPLSPRRKKDVVFGGRE